MEPFITAVRSGDPAKNNCDAEVAHYSAALCHLGNIAYRMGQPLQFQHKPKLVGDNAQVAESLGALDENLRAVKIDLAEYNMLQFDPATEKFVNDEQANSLLTRWYRAPFVVPETV